MRQLQSKAQSSKDPATHDRRAELVAKAKEFDRWFSQFTNLYKVMLKYQLGPRHRKALPFIRGPRVLEVSFGLGYLMSLYADRYETTGLDYNARYVEETRRRLAELNLKAELVEGDAHHLPFADERFDTLVNTDAFTLYDDPRQAMSEFYRVLVPGGRLVLMEWDYPRDGNLLGRIWVQWARFTKMPHIDFAKLLTEVGFSYEDHSVGGSGTLHMFVATKPERSAG